MTPDLRAKLQGELSRLTEGNSPQNKATFSEGFWRNVQNWEDRFRTDSESALRDVGRAYLARILVSEHPGSPQYAQAMREDFQHRTSRQVNQQLDSKATLGSACDALVATC